MHVVVTAMKHMHVQVELDHMWYSKSEQVELSNGS